MKIEELVKECKLKQSAREPWLFKAEDLKIVQECELIMEWDFQKEIESMVPESSRVVGC